VLSGGLDRELEHRQRLGEEGMSPEARESATSPPLSGQGGLREQDHPATLGDPPRKSRGAHQLLEEILDRRRNGRTGLLRLTALG
jgi:hypothetical protein